MGVLDRLMLVDEQWERMSQHIIGDARTRGSTGHDNRMFVEAVLWIVRTGTAWRDLPDVFGNWNSAFRGSVEIFVLEAIVMERKDPSYGDRQGTSGSASCGP